jgi:hypothetical protein
VYSEQFAYLDWMFFVVLLVVIYTSISFASFNRPSLSLLQWAPRQGRVDGTSRRMNTSRPPLKGVKRRISGA